MGGRARCGMTHDAFDALSAELQFEARERALFGRTRTLPNVRGVSPFIPCARLDGQSEGQKGEN